VGEIRVSEIRVSAIRVIGSRVSKRRDGLQFQAQGLHQ